MALILRPAPAEIGSDVRGPQRQPGVPAAAGVPELVEADPAIRVVVDDVEIFETWGRSWQRGISDAGSGSFTVDSANPVLATIDYGSEVGFTFFSARRHTAIVERIERNIIDPREEIGQTVTFSGRGLVAEWDKALIYPDLATGAPTGSTIQMGPPRQDNRYFNWTALAGMNRNSWPIAVVTDPRYGCGSDALPAQMFAQPDGWPESTAAWIWDRVTTVSAPVGDAYFGHTFTVSSAGRHQVWTAGNDDYEVWIDGVRIAEREGYYSGQSDFFEIELSAASHLIAARVTNYSGPAGLLVSIHPVSSSGVLGTAVTKTSSSGWRVLGYPAAAPGMTVGSAILLLWQAAVVRGMLTGWTLGFNGSVDSNGRPWPVLANLDCQVGVSILSFLDQLAETHIDYSTEPAARTLLCYRIGEMSGSGGLFGSVGDPSPLIELSVSGEG